MKALLLITLLFSTSIFAGESCEDINRFKYPEEHRICLKIETAGCQNTELKLSGEEIGKWAGYLLESAGPLALKGAEVLSKSKVFDKEREHGKDVELESTINEDYASSVTK